MKDINLIFIILFVNGFKKSKSQSYAKKNRGEYKINMLPDGVEELGKKYFFLNMHLIDNVIKQEFF